MWLNQAQPPAPGGLIGWNINTGNKEAAPQGFEFLANIGDHPIRRSRSSAPARWPTAAGWTTQIVRHLALLRTVTPWHPATAQPWP